MARLPRRLAPCSANVPAHRRRDGLPLGEADIGRLVGGSGDGLETGFEGVIDPVDPDLFSFLSGIYSSAACLLAPLELAGNASNITHTHASRGLLAVKKELVELKVRDQLPYFWRLMHFSDVLRARERLGALITDSEGGGSLQVAQAVMHAAATARFVVEGQHAHFDLDDLVRRAREYAAAHPA